MPALVNLDSASELMGNEPPRRPNILVIGIGNAYRSDDAAGLIAARRVKDQVSEHCSVMEHSGEGAALIELWKDADRVIVIDAVRSGAAPGTVSRFDATLHPLPASMFRDSTHAFSLPEATELSRALKQLPRQLIVYGVEAQNFEAGTNLSPAIDFAMQTVVQRVLQELSRNTPHSQT
jgi:hydrogenase maturation protease